MRARRRLPVLAAALAAIWPVAAAARVDVVPAGDVLARYVVQDRTGTRLVFGGRSLELVTDATDPAISSLSDGAFHPMDAAEIEAAVREVSAILPDATILALPFPRRDVLESCCEGSVVFLAPGIRPVQPEHLHATVVHELGHVVENARCPDGSMAWREYVALRDLGAAVVSKNSPHRDQPREIFAEDFRFLEGGALARSSGVIENPNLPLPSDVAGLAAWFHELGAASWETDPARGGDSGGAAAPNPFRSPTDGIVTVRLQLPPGGASSATGLVLDVTGRRLRTLRGVVSGSTLELTWDGADGQGRRVASGIYFVAAAGAARTPTVRVHVLR